MVMEISIKEEEPDVDYTVAINNEIIQTNISYHRSNKRHHIAQRWVQAIRRFYLKKLPRNESLIVGLCVAECWYREQYTSLNLSVGSHCLIVDVEVDYWKESAIAAPLRSFLSDPNVIFVGVDIAGIVKKLEEGNNVQVTARTVDLRTLVEQALGRDDLGRYSLERLAKLVLGDEMDLNKPYGYDRMDDAETYMYFTADAFLSYKIGVRCMEILGSKKVEEKA